MLDSDAKIDVICRRCIQRGQAPDPVPRFAAMGRRGWKSQKPMMTLFAPSAEEVESEEVGT
jgi:hypothetical protein